MYKNLIISIFFLFFFISFDSVFSNNIVKMAIDSLEYDIQNRVLVTITENKNVISLNEKQGIKAVKIISASPLDGLDFREYPSLIIRVEKDGNEILNVKLMDFVKGKNKKKRIAYFSNEDFTFSGFTDLKIIIEDKNLELKRFRIDFWLYLR